ncbi:MAG: lamin tail domain-containing protein, partial [FCB group bacterium]|nr:lamin tail domain-containing protein [FCB group bacterium]
MPRTVQKITVFAGFIFILSLLSPLNARYYEPPINFFFIIHVEPLSWGPYEIRIEFLTDLYEEVSSRPSQPKFTILMNGDFMELAIGTGDSSLLKDMERDGHELGGHCHNLVRISPYNWADAPGTDRYGRPVYEHTLTQQIWSDNLEQLMRLTDDYRTICACPFLCSTESGLMTEFGFSVAAGDRSEACLDYTGILARHPFRPGAVDLLGHELEEDLNTSFIMLDHYAQIGKDDAHGYNCTADSMFTYVDQCYQEWLERESQNLDSLDYYIWTFGFLTHLRIASPYYLDQIVQFLDYLDANYINHYSENGNLISRYATAAMIENEFLQWEDYHPDWSSFSYVYEYPNNIKINEVMYKPEGLAHGDEWLELYNPTETDYDLYRWIITNAYLTAEWQFPMGSVIESGQYITIAKNGANFYQNYGFYPDYEAYPATPAINLITNGELFFEDSVDAVILQTADSGLINYPGNWTDIYSWGKSWCAGFCDTVEAAEGHSMARDSASTDTETPGDWQEDGINSVYPTPGMRN